MAFPLYTALRGSILEWPLGPDGGGPSPAVDFASGIAYHDPAFPR